MKAGFVRSELITAYERQLLQVLVKGLEDARELANRSGRRAMARGLAGVVGAAVVSGGFLPRTKAALFGGVALIALLLLAFFGYVYAPTLIAAKKARGVTIAWSDKRLEGALGTGFDGRVVRMCRDGSVLLLGYASDGNVGFTFSERMIPSSDVLSVTVIGCAAPLMVRIVVRGIPVPLYAGCAGRSRQLRRAFENWHESPWAQVAP